VSAAREGALVVNEQLSIARPELTFRASRSGGPGGQHVNTSSTRVELLWDVSRSRSLTTDQRARLFVKLASRMDGDGIVRVVASEYRTQSRNRVAAAERLAEMVRAALRVPRARKATRPTRGSIEQRLKVKRARSEQ
jgi:ribosome-associated protein